MPRATEVQFIIAVNTRAGCYGIGETQQEAVKNCNKEVSRLVPRTQPDVFYYFGNCEQKDITITCGLDLQIVWPPTAVVMRFKDPKERTRVVS
jgi:hypothetical protein